MSTIINSANSIRMRDPAAWEIGVASTLVADDQTGEDGFGKSISTDPNVVNSWTSTLRAQADGCFGRLCYLRITKPTLDVVIASILVVIFVPLFILVGIAIKLDSRGPALFKQKRVGLNGKSFTMLKFRTMEWNAQPNRLVYMTDDDGKLKHKIRNDPRITRVGKFIRKTSLDELPQLINVLRGQMSLVGPRPELVDIVSKYEPWQHERHLVRPGITGWWQVEGRSQQPMYEHTDMDLYYVNSISWKLDLVIIKRTVGIVFGRRGAI